MQMNDESRRLNSVQCHCGSWNPWVVVGRCWKWALPLGSVLACLVAWFILQSHVPIYQARSLVERLTPILNNPENARMENRLAVSDRALVLSSDVIEAAMTRPEASAASDLNGGAESVKQRLSTDGKGSTMIVSFQDEDPKLAADACNAIVDVYLEHRKYFDGQRNKSEKAKVVEMVRLWQGKFDECKESVESMHQLSDRPTAKKQRDEELELFLASEILKKLKQQLVYIRFNESDSVNRGVRLVAKAKPPKQPFNSFPGWKAAVASAVVFLFPFVLGFVYGFRPVSKAESAAPETAPRSSELRLRYRFSIRLCIA